MYSIIVTILPWLSCTVGTHGFLHTYIVYACMTLSIIRSCMATANATANPMQTPHMAMANPMHDHGNVRAWTAHGPPKKLHVRV